VCQCAAVCCSVLWHWPGWCCSRLAVLWVCVAVCCRVFQCIAVCFSVLQCVVAWAPLVPQLAGFLVMTQGSVAVCCNVLQCVAFKS